MKYLRLVYDCQFFSAHHDVEGLILNWNLGLDLSPFKYLSLVDFQIGPMIPKPGDHLLYIHTNMIARTLYNPCRELTSIRIGRNSRFIERLPRQGMTHHYSDEINIVLTMSHD